jgi:hypothetical protein
VKSEGMLLVAKLEEKGGEKKRKKKERKAQVELGRSFK